MKISRKIIGCHEPTEKVIACFGASKLRGLKIDTFNRGSTEVSATDIAPGWSG